MAGDLGTFVFFLPAWGKLITALNGTKYGGEGGEGEGEASSFQDPFGTDLRQI